MISRSFVLIILLFLQLPSNAQQTQEDSVHFKLSIEPVDSVKANLLIEYAEKHTRTAPATFFKYSLEAYDLSVQKKFDNGIVKSALNLGYYYRTRARYDSSLFFYKDALHHCSASNAQLPNIHYNIGNVLKAQGDFVKAIESYLESLRLAEKLASVKDAAIAQLGLGNVYLIQNNAEKALEYFLRSSASFNEIGDKRGVYISANNIGSSYFKLKEYGKAKTYFMDARALAVSYNDTRGLGNIFSNLSSIYREEDQYDSALVYGLNALEIRQKFQNKEETIISYHSLAELNIYMQKFSDAEVYLDKALDLASEIESIKELKYNWNYRAMLDSTRGNYRAAFYALQKYNFYRYRLEEKQVKSEIEQLQAKYDTEKKEAEIASLSQQAAIQALEIRQKNQAIIIGIIVFLLVLGVLFFIYKQQQTKKKQSRIELEQRFLLSQLNPHFISNALVAAQSFMLKNDAHSAASYLTKFSKLMREILENSRRKFIPVEEEVSMLTNYMEIHQQRLGSFEYSIDLDDEINAEEDTIPPMFVQPFLENAVEHGIGHLKEGGKISLKFRKEGEFITININDNGKGLIIDTKSDHRSLSTKIIQERIDLFNRTLKKKIQLVIDNIRTENGEVGGTKVELKVPFGYL